MFQKFHAIHFSLMRLKLPPCRFWGSSSYFLGYGGTYGWPYKLTSIANYYYFNCNCCILKKRIYCVGNGFQFIAPLDLFASILIFSLINMDPCVILILLTFALVSFSKGWFLFSGGCVKAALFEMDWCKILHPSVRL